MKRLILLLSVVLAGLISLNLRAAPTVTSLYPAGAQAGTTVTITATGTWEKWPVEVWVSQPRITAKALKDQGKFQITVPKETPAGLIWFRFFDPTGGSQLRPFLIGDQTDLLEVEPNDLITKPQLLTGPAAIHGKLIKSGDVDCFALNAKRGETIVASLDAHFQLRSPIDAVLQILGPDDRSSRKTTTPADSIHRRRSRLPRMALTRFDSLRSPQRRTAASAILDPTSRSIG